MHMAATTLRRRIRVLLWVFIVGLVLSGATALPLEAEVRLLVGTVQGTGLAPTALIGWLVTVHDALLWVNTTYPFLAYGTDWLAFGHFVIAIAFIGPLRKPVQNVWVIEFGMIACALVVPFALVLGAMRGIPFWWRLIDCSFGVFGVIPLWLCRRYIRQLATVHDAGGEDPAEQDAPPARAASAPT
jgi:hypothetical protein